jgi:MFS family permease
MMFGYDAGVLAGVQNTEPFLSAHGHPEQGSSITIPMIASSYTLGAWVMSMCISFIAQPLGRRGCILTGNVLVLIGGSLQAASFSVAQIIVGRVLCGFGIGFISSNVPTYMVGRRSDFLLHFASRGGMIDLETLLTHPSGRDEHPARPARP